MNDPSPKAALRGRARLQRGIKRLLILLEQNAPEIIIAGEVLNIFDAGVLACGQNLFLEMGRRMIIQERAENGLCKYCDTEVAPVSGHEGICEQCDTKLAEDFNEIE